MWQTYSDLLIEFDLSFNMSTYVLILAVIVASNYNIHFVVYVLEVLST